APPEAREGHRDDDVGAKGVAGVLTGQEACEGRNEAALAAEVEGVDDAARVALVAKAGSKPLQRHRMLSAGVAVVVTKGQPAAVAATAVGPGQAVKAGVAEE